MSIRSLVASVAVGLLASRANAQCRAFGKDFQNKGIYFQNASSTEQFTFVQYFQGCQQDLASNILIDPAAEEYECTKTPLTPDNADQQSTCPITKNNLYSGDWSIIIASNNGKAEPIAYERDFSLIVGVPTTFTFFPTVTVTSTKTPTSIKSVTTTTPATTTSTKTVTSPLVTVKPTTTVTPSRVTVTTTQFTSTFTKKSFTAEPLITTSYYTKTCSIPPSQTYPDTSAQYSPTLLSATAANKRDEPTPAVLVIRDAGEVNLDDVRKSKAQFIEERRKRLQDAAKIARRGLDQASTTITATDPKQFITATSVVTATITETVTTTIEATSFSTFTTTSTYLSGTTTAKQTTITAPTPTSTKTVKTVKTVTTTITQKPLITIIIPTATPGASASCKSRGGKLV